MSLPRLFMLVYTDGQPLRAVFHGPMQDREMNALSDQLNVPGMERIRLVILEKYKDDDDGYKYTILTLGCDDKDQLEKRVNAIFPGARKVHIEPSEITIHELVRSVVIL